jgi:hypothetical protein
MANPIGDLLNSLTTPPNPVVQIANQAADAIHGVVEGAGEMAGLDNTTEGLTNASEAIGLGEIGGSNLITDAAQAPGDIINGVNPVTVISEIVTDAGEGVGAGGGILEGLGSDLASSPLLSGLGQAVSGVVNAVTGLLPFGPGGFGVAEARGSGEATATVDQDGAEASANGSALLGGHVFGDALQFPDLAGTGTDSLNGITPSVLSVPQFNGGADGSISRSGASSFDAHTDGTALAHVIDNPEPNPGFDDQAII